MPFSLRYELNGNVLQEEQVKSVQHNVTFVADPFAIPEAVRNQKTDAAPIASQWILRRVAGNVSYLDFGRPREVEWNRLADGVHKIQGVGHATIVVEMRDHLVVVEGPLYDARTAPVVQSIKEKFPNKPIRYAVPTHHHLDHAGGIRAFMATGATVVVPFCRQRVLQPGRQSAAYAQTGQLGEAADCRRHRSLRRRPAHLDRRPAARRGPSPALVARGRLGRGLLAD